MIEPRTVPRTEAIWTVAILGALAIALTLISYFRAASLQFDFRHFYLDAAYVWHNGALNPDSDSPEPLKRRQLPFYLPAVSIWLAPLTAGGPGPAAVAWAGLQGGAFLICMWLLSKWRSGAAGASVGALLLTALLAAPAINEAAKFNQLSFFVLALVLAGIYAVQRRRNVSAGLWFGAAIVLKLLPAIFLLWMVVKREWRALGWTLVFAAGLDLVPSLIVFGPQRTIQYHQQWFDYNIHGASVKGMVDDEAELADHLIDRRNQSIPTVVSRLFWPEHPYRIDPQPLQLSRAACLAIAYGIAAALCAALIWQTRRRARADSEFAWHAGAAAYLLGMLIFSPLLRQYYLVWCIPDLLLLTQAACSKVDRAARLGILGLLIWLAGMVAWAFKEARVFGAHLLMLVLLMFVLLAVGRQMPPRPQEAGSDGD